VPTRVEPGLRTAVVWSVLREAVDRLAAERGEPLEVLDVGGGTGGLAVPLAGLGHRVTVVDPSPDALAALERRVAESDLAGTVVGVQGELADLAAGTGAVVADQVDVVLCHGVLEQVDEPAAALAGVAAVLRPGGRASVLVANRHAAVVSRALGGHFVAAQTALGDPRGRWGEGDPVPRRYGPEEIEALLAAAGLPVDALHGVRVFTDLVPGALVDLEPGATEALRELELAVAAEPAFRAVAAQLHALATRR
jgi:SAM-dependent methyltransferase